MTILELKKIIKNLENDTVVLIEVQSLTEVESVNVTLHSDGRTHLILSTVE